MMASARCTIFATGPYLGVDVDRWSAYFMGIGGLMTVFGGIFTGVGYADGGADKGDIFIFAPILLALALFLTITGIVIKVLIIRRSKHGENAAHGDILELPPNQLKYPRTMSQPVSLTDFPPPYTVEIQSTDISQGEGPPMYTPSVEIQNTDISQEGPPVYTPSVEIQNTDISQEGPPTYTPSPGIDATMESSAYVNEVFLY